MATIVFPRSYHAGKMQLKNGEILTYGSLRVEGEFFYCYTGKGLREIYKLRQTDEEKK
jgi:hypothetical protein